MRDPHPAVRPSFRAPDPLPLIAETPWRFDFFHALRLIDALYATLAGEKR